MYTLQTNLTQFRIFTNKTIKDSYLIQWYKLEENEDNSESYGICMNTEEIQKLTDFITQHPHNFSNPKNSNCDNEDVSIPRCGNLDLKPIKSSFPKHLVLRKKPLMPHNLENIFSCMDIELLENNGELKYPYTLSFDVVGKIL